MLRKPWGSCRLLRKALLLALVPAPGPRLRGPHVTDPLGRAQGWGPVLWGDRQGATLGLGFRVQGLGFRV